MFGAMVRARIKIEKVDKGEKDTRWKDECNAVKWSPRGLRLPTRQSFTSSEQTFQGLAQKVFPSIRCCIGNHWNSCCYSQA